MSKLCIKIANWLEKLSVSIRKSVIQKKHKKFLKKYGLKEACEDVPRSDGYNPYQCTNLYMVDELLKRGIIAPDKKLLDVGCGSGILLSYLYTKGITKLSGVEIDEEIAKIACNNIKKVAPQDNIEIKIADIIDCEIENDVDIIYLFNPFQRKEAYEALISKIEDSASRAPREITVVLLCPSAASTDAFSSASSLSFVESVTSPYQFCNKCVRYSIYKTVRTV